MPPRRKAVALVKRKLGSDDSSSVTGKKLRKDADSDTSASKSIGKPRRSGSFSWFMKVYKGLEDWHIPIFNETKAYTRANHVLYPGCDKHLTASLVFPSVVYVDFNKKLEAVFKDELVLKWIEENKTYLEKQKINFLCKNFDTTFEKPASFDLLISACAGIVSEKCTKYLKTGGYFLVSDAHFDARTIFLNPKFILEGVFDSKTGKLGTDTSDLEGHFTTMTGDAITKEQVEESLVKPKNRRSFRLKKEAMFYLFKKI